MPALSVKLRVLLTAAGSIGPFAAHGVRLELRPYFERERRERGELGGEDERRVLDGGPRVPMRRCMIDGVEVDANKTGVHIWLHRRELGYLRIYGEENRSTLMAASNYAMSLRQLNR